MVTFSAPPEKWVETVINRMIRYPDTRSNATPEEIRRGRIAEFLIAKLLEIEPCLDLRVRGRRYLVTETRYEEVKLAYSLPDYDKLEVKSGGSVNKRELEHYNPSLRIIHVPEIREDPGKWTASGIRETAAGELLRYLDAENLWRSGRNNRPYAWIDHTPGFLWKEVVRESA
jgi:hypothetical protein